MSGLTALEARVAATEGDIVDLENEPSSDPIYEEFFVNKMPITLNASGRMVQEVLVTYPCTLLEGQIVEVIATAAMSDQPPSGATDLWSLKLIAPEGSGYYYFGEIVAPAGGVEPKRVTMIRQYVAEADIDDFSVVLENYVMSAVKFDAEDVQVWLRVFDSDKTPGIDTVPCGL